MKQERLNRRQNSAGGLAREVPDAGNETGPEKRQGPGDTVFPGGFRRKGEWAEYKCKDLARQHNSLKCLES
jgi:hypothetical protein